MYLCWVKTFIMLLLACDSGFVGSSNEMNCKLELVELPTGKQGIIVSTGTETFAKEPKFVKLLRELKLTPVSYNGFSRMPVMANFLCFWFFATG